MRSVQLFLCCLFLLVAVSPALADETLTLKVGYQLLQPSGQFAGTKDGFGTLVDIEDDLNFDESSNVTAEVALHLGDFRLSAGYLPIRTEGRGANLGLAFNGRAFTGTIDGKIDADIFDVALAYYLINMDDAPSRLQLGLEVAAKLIDADLRVTETLTGVSENVTGMVPIPTVGGRLRVALGDYFGIVGRAGYMSYSDNHFLDAEGQIEFSPLPTLGVYGGYRHLEVKVDETDVLLDAKFSGPFVGALIRF